MRREAEEDVRLRREESQRLEDRLARQEDDGPRHEQALEARQRTSMRASRTAQARRQAGTIRAELERVAERQRRARERIGQLTAHEAQEALMAQVVDEAKRDAMAPVREIEQRAREEGEKRARKIVTIAIQRVAADQTIGVDRLGLPAPVRGHEGQDHRPRGPQHPGLRGLTGVNLIIDDTPEAVVLSCFDPVRREIARQTLEKLVSDGRIHPARIEEMYQRSAARWTSRSSGRARRPWSRSASPTSTRRWSRSSAGSSTGPPTGRTSSGT